MSNFPIIHMVHDIGEAFTMSGISGKTYNNQGDATETYTAYIISGIVQVTDGTMEEVKEGLIGLGDIVTFVDETEPASGNIKVGNFVTISTTISGIFRVVNVIRNDGHIEFYGKRIKDLTP